MAPSSYLALAQRVLNDLKRTTLSPGRMIWLLAHPLPPLTHIKKKRKTICLNGKGGEGEEPNH
jgi:hypothetical protein